MFEMERLAKQQQAELRRLAARSLRSRSRRSSAHAWAPVAPVGRLMVRAGSRLVCLADPACTGLPAAG